MEQTALFSILPAITSLSFLLSDPNVTFSRILLYLLPMSIPIISYFHKKQYTWIWNLFQRRGKSLDFTSRLRLNTWDDEPDSIVRKFSTVLWEWNRQNKTANCINLIEESVDNHYYHYEHADKRQPPIFVDDPATFFWNVDQPNIQYKMWVDRNTDRDGNSLREIFLTMRFLKDKPSAIVDHIDFLKAESTRIITLREAKAQRVLVSIQGNSESSERGSHGPGFMVYEFKTTTSFDNFFSEEAKTVYKDIQLFLNDKKSYERTGRPWTYSILNEGPPGVGKTKLVKAIAAYTGYTLIVINLNHISSAQQLYEAFHMSSLAGEDVPHDKRLYYIPEVDTQMYDLLKKRETATKNFVTVEDKKDTTEKPTVHTAKPTLGEILNIIDGIPERHGHILIMDTNCLKDLDPALIRPGRIDRILSWKSMSALSIQQYLENYYMKSVPRRATLPDRTLTAAKLQSIVSNSPNLEACLLALKN